MDMHKVIDAFGGAHHAFVRLGFFLVAEELAIIGQVA